VTPSRRARKLRLEGEAPTAPRRREQKDSVNAATIDLRSPSPRRPGANPPTTREHKLRRRGSRIGNYTIKDVIGWGGMGVVYAAYDSQLGRHVAIKVLRRDDSSQDAGMGSRLLREAQSMARLSHPNVITVYEVGTVGGEIFVSMELAEGTTLGEWLMQPRRWQEIVNAFIEAGRGLEAAHRAQLIHRDFKPDNVIVSLEGRVRVTDFGLARATEERQPEPQWDAPTSPRAKRFDLTTTGEILGTPLYMAPEQHGLGQVDARSDQFSFAVALYEALHGAHPFASSSLPELIRRVTTGDRHPPPSWVKLPRQLRAALDRAMSPSPAARFPSMREFLTELEAVLAPRGRQLGLAAAIGGIAALAAAAGGLWVARDREGIMVRSDPSCEEAGEGIAAVWPAHRADLEKAFRAAPAVRSEPALNAVNRALDEYAADWTAMAVQSCTATHSGLQSQALYDRRAACLAQRQREMSDLVDVLVAADAKVVEHAVDSVHALGVVAQCEDALVLDRGLPLPTDPEQRAAIEKVRALVSRATANAFVGRGEPAARLLDEAAKELPATDYAPVDAELHLARGRLETLTGNFARAKQELLRASDQAEAAGYDLARARALVDLVYVVGYELQDFDQGELFFRLASGPLQRAGGDRALEATRLRNGGMASFLAEDLQRARERQLNALSIREKLYGPESGEVAEVLRELAATLRELGQLDEALGHAQKSLDIVERIYGKKHRNYGLSLTELGNVLTARGEYDSARGVYEETLTLGYEVLSADHPLIAVGKVNLGNVELLLGNSRKAIEKYKEALALESKTLGSDHLSVAQTLMNLGAAYESAGQLALAEETYARALSNRRKHLDEHHALVGQALGSVGLIALKRGRFAQATEDLKHALDLAEEGRAGPQHLGELRFGLAPRCGRPVAIGPPPTSWPSEPSAS